jgi:hypothetical protein
MHNRHNIFFTFESEGHKLRLSYSIDISTVPCFTDYSLITVCVAIHNLYSTPFLSVSVALSAWNEYPIVCFIPWNKALSEHNKEHHKGLRRILMFGHHSFPGHCSAAIAGQPAPHAA